MPVPMTVHLNFGKMCEIGTKHLKNHEKIFTVDAPGIGSFLPGNRGKMSQKCQKMTHTLPNFVNLRVWG